MRVLTIRELPEDDRLRQSWDGLVQQMDKPEVFYTHEWAGSVATAYSSVLQPLVMQFFDGDQLVAIAPLATSPDGKDAFFLNSTTADYCDFIGKEEHRSEVVQAALAEIDRLAIRRVVFANLPADSSTIAALQGAVAQSPFHLHVRDAYRCARIVLGSPEQRAEQKLRVTRKEMYRRALKKMSKRGTVDVIHQATWQDVQVSLPTFYAAHVSRFRAAGRMSNIASQERQTFLDSLAQSLANAGWLKLSVLLLDGNPIAWNFGFRFHGSWFWYQPAFDRKYEDLSPGYCLLGKIIEAACDSPDIHIFDLGLGAEGYKERFLTESRQTLHVTLNRSYAAHVRTILRHQTVSWIRKYPPLETAIRTLLGRA